MLAQINSTPNYISTIDEFVFEVELTGSPTSGITERLFYQLTDAGGNALTQRYAIDHINGTLTLRLGTLVLSFIETLFPVHTNAILDSVSEGYGKDVRLIVGRQIIDEATCSITYTSDNSSDTMYVVNSYNSINTFEDVFSTSTSITSAKSVILTSRPHTTTVNVNTPDFIQVYNPIDGTANTLNYEVKYYNSECELMQIFSGTVNKNSTRITNLFYYTGSSNTLFLLPAYNPSNPTQEYNGIDTVNLENQDIAKIEIIFTGKVSKSYTVKILGCDMKEVAYKSAIYSLDRLGGYNSLPFDILYSLSRKTGTIRSFVDISDKGYGKLRTGFSSSNNQSFRSFNGVHKMRRNNLEIIDFTEQFFNSNSFYIYVDNNIATPVGAAINYKFNKAILENGNIKISQDGGVLEVKFKGRMGSNLKAQ